MANVNNIKCVGRETAPGRDVKFFFFSLLLQTITGARTLLKFIFGCVWYLAPERLQFVLSQHRER